MLYTLVPRGALLRHLNLSPALAAPEYDRLDAALTAATETAERWTQRRLIPRFATLPHTPSSGAAWIVFLQEDLLALHSVADGDGTLSSDALYLHPTDGSPFYQLMRLEGRFSSTAPRAPSVMVTGVWGWHSQPSLMWQPTTDTLSAPLDALSAALPVPNALALAADGITPRYDVGALLRLGDEFLRVIAVDTSTHTLTVARGMHGTSTSTHPAETPLMQYQPPAALQDAVLQLAAWRYRQADQPTAAPPMDVLRELVAMRRVSVA